MHIMTQHERVNILGIGVSALDLERAVEIMGQWIEADAREYIIVCPVYTLMQAVEHPDLRTVVNQAGMVTTPMACRWYS